MQTSEIKRGKTYTDGKGIRRAVVIFPGWTGRDVDWAGCNGAGRLEGGVCSLKAFARWAKEPCNVTLEIEVAP